MDIIGKFQNTLGFPKNRSSLKKLTHMCFALQMQKKNQRFNVINFSAPCFVVHPKETTEEGAIGGGNDPSTSQEEGKKYVIMYMLQVNFKFRLFFSTWV